ncbi:MAG: hypothetical protein Kilf2KO_29900 [Rhodospirillales bacterium]
MTRISTPTITGVLVGDQRKDQVLLLRDRNGDGDAADAGETGVFFDEANASGLAAPSENVFTLHQASDKSVYVGDGTTDSVYRLRDANNDGDAQDAGEAGVWFSADNAAGLSTVTPNGIHEGADGAIYIANAGTSSAPQDAIYRTVDLNGDGDANDAGEASVWLDVQSVIDTAVPFDLSFDGSVAYLNDLTGATSDAIYRIEDKNGDHAIQGDEVRPFITDDMNFGAPVDIASAVGVGGSLYTLTWFPPAGEISKLFRLTDLDGSEQIDAQNEAVEVWNADALPEGFDMFVGFSVAADEDGKVTLTADGNVVSLSDLNGDGDFLDAGETEILGSDQFDDQLDRPRAVEFYEGEAQIVASTVGAGNHFSVFLDQASNRLFSTGENVVGQLGNGSVGFDVKTPLPVTLPDGFSATITSVSAGLLHTTFLTDGGDVYAFGFNNRGPLGTGDEDTRTQAVLVEALDDVNVIGIENGNGVSFALAEDGRLFAWGNNANGQLGLGDLEERLLPTAVEALADETVVAVSSGTSHTLVLTADGQVYAFGSASDGQLGSPEAFDGEGDLLRRVESPIQVEGLPDKLVAVSADGKTSFAVTEDGRVFGWGESRNGQLLQGSDNDDGTFQPDPADVPAPVELTQLPEGVIDVKAGARWGAALTADGDVYVWGPNDEGPSGGLDGDPAAESDASFYPTKIALLDEVTVIEIQTGPNSIIAVTDDGRIFTWGSNSDGRLGFASEGSVYFPTQVDLTGDADPFLLAAQPGDNARDVANDSALELTFTEDVKAGEGKIRLVNRDSGEVTEIDVTDAVLVRIDGSQVTVLPPSHLDVDTRYAVEIDEGAFVDLAGQGYAGIPEGDGSTFNFTTAEEAADSQENLFGSLDDDLLRGGAQDDRIVDHLGDNLLSGGGGNDFLRGGIGQDRAFGDDGNDVLRTSLGDDEIYGGDGNDSIAGGLGDDRAWGGEGSDLMVGGLGDDSLFGDGGNDWLKGNLGDDSLFGGEGDDKLSGRFGDNLLSGDAGSDLIIGGIGDDTAFGGSDSDQLVGGLGADWLDGGSGDDQLTGGLGADVFVFNGGTDLITDFNPVGDSKAAAPEADRIVLEIEGVDSFEAVMASALQAGKLTLLDFGDQGTLVLNNTDLDDLEAGMFSFA